jgi:RNA polymerase sigma-70 factor, ECF subfamily
MGPSTPVSLREAFVAAKTAWPRIILTYEQFQAYVAQRERAPASVPAYPADVYLCTACVNGQDIAYQSLEATYFPSLESAIYHVVGERPAVDDVLQEVRTRLFVGRAPKIASYRGSGSLGGWLRKVAVRASQDYRREKAMQYRRRRRLLDAERTTAIRVDAPDDRAFSEERVRLCEQAWTRAICSLGSTDRQLLHHYFVSQLSIDTLGPIYSVHRATIARRIRRILERVRQHVRKTLAERHRGLSAEDLDALMLHSCRELDLSATLEVEQPRGLEA